MRWTESEAQYIRANAGIMSDHDLARNLTIITGRHVTRIAVIRKRQNMGIWKRRGRGLALIETNTLMPPDLTDPEMLGRDRKSGKYWGRPVKTPKK